MIQRIVNTLKYRVPMQHVAYATVNGERIIAVFRTTWGGAITEARWFSAQERRSALDA